MFKMKTISVSCELYYPACILLIRMDKWKVSKYKQYEHIFDKGLKGLKFPINVRNIATFVKGVNKLKLVEGGPSINVYNSENGILLFDVTNDEKKKHIDLLYLKEDEKSHYSWIKDLWKVVGGQITKRHLKRYLCKKCFISFPTEEKLTDHRK